MACNCKTYNEGQLSFTCEIKDTDLQVEDMRRYTEKTEKNKWKIGINIKRSSLGWYYPIIKLQFGRVEYKFGWSSTVYVNFKVTNWSIEEYVESY